MRVLAIIPESAEKIKAIAECCLILTPQIALGETAIFLEIGASAHLYSEAECLCRIEHILTQFNTKSRIAFAEDIASALAYAQYGIRQKELLPIEALGELKNPFRPEAFREAHLFRKLGISTIGSLLSLSKEEITTRFGKEAIKNLHFSHPTAWPRFIPEEKIIETAEFDYTTQVDNLAPLLFLIKKLIDRIFIRLLARRLKLSALKIEIKYNHLNPSLRKGPTFLLSFPIAQSEAPAVMRNIQEKLYAEAEKNPFDHALESLSIQVIETAPFLDSQKDFFTRIQEEKEAFGALLTQLQIRLGKSASFLAKTTPRRLPESSWEKCDENHQHAYINQSLRPLRILSKPEEIIREKSTLRIRQRIWQIKQFKGPERISGEWWLAFFSRDYYRVETDQEDLWIFQSNGKLYLHGYFD